MAPFSLSEFEVTRKFNDGLICVFGGRSAVLFTPRESRSYFLAVAAECFEDAVAAGGRAGGAV